ncbi:MAG: caspase family protein [Caldilineaceae bacterium]
MPQAPIFALLVGINTYASRVVPDLAGCVNDVEAMANLLQSNFAIPQAQIKILTNAAATHAAIEAAFQNHLIAPLQQWDTAGRPGEKPGILFYFSGHGSQAPDPTGRKPSRLDETLVPHDSRADEVYDIKDWELGQWLAEAARYTDNVNVILDCCHSGSGTRGDEKVVTDVRGCDIDARLQPLPPGFAPTPNPPQPAVVYRGALNLNPHTTEPDYVLLAACRNDQKARETYLGTQQQRHGLLTYWLITTVQQMPAQQPLRYGDLYERVRHQIVSQYKDQTPQCEGDRNRIFLDERRALRSARLSVLATRNDQIQVDAGQVHGLVQGAILYLYPPELDELAGVEPTLVLVAETVAATTAWCRRAEGYTNTPLPEGAQVIIHQLGPAAQRVTLALTPAEGWTANTVRARLLQEDIAPLISLAAPGGGAALQLILQPDIITLQNGAGQALQHYAINELNRFRRPLQAKDLDPVIADLLHLVRQEQFRQLGAAASAILPNVLEVTVQRQQVRQDVNGTAVIHEALATDTEGRLVAPVDQPLTIILTNRSKKPLYCYLLELGYRGDIIRIYPPVAGLHEALAAGASLTIGAAETTGSLIMSLPDGVDEVDETFKIIATTEPTDFDYLLQDELLQDRLPQRPAPTGPVMRSGQRVPSEENTKTFRTFHTSPASSTAGRWRTIDLKLKVVQGG